MRKLWAIFVIVILFHSLVESKKRDCKGCKWCTEKVKRKQKKPLYTKKAIVEDPRSTDKNQKKSLSKRSQKRESLKSKDELKKEKIDPLARSQQLIDAIKDNKPLMILEELIEKGVDVDYQDKEKRTPLHWAAVYALPDAVELLLIHKADIYAQDYRGNTPLHLVSMFRSHPSNREKIIRLLLFEGASIYDRNSMGLNVLEAAITTKLRNFTLLTSFKRSFIRRTTT